VITAGIDAGAATTKVVITRGREIVGYKVSPTAFDFLTAAEETYHDLLETLKIGRDEVGTICTTGIW